MLTARSIPPKNSTANWGRPATALFRALHAALPESSSIIDEIVAQAPQMAEHLFESKLFRQYRGWFGGLGTGLETALGVKLAEPERTVVGIIGDGALHYNPVPAALGCPQEYGVPILIVVLRQPLVCLTNLERAQIFRRRDGGPDGQLHR